MKISGRKGKDTGNVVFTKKVGDVRGTESPSGVNAIEGVSGSNAPSVAISDRGKLVAEAHRSLAALPEIRVERVGQIQSALESGTYHVEGEQVAEKMVTDAVQEIRNRIK